MFSWLKKYFVPNEGNGYKPHFLRGKSVTIVLAAIILIELAFLTQTLFVFKKTDFLSAVLPGVLSALTNNERAQNGAQELSYSPVLERAAKLKAEDMAKRGYFSHTGPDGELPWSWLDKAEYDYSYAGENLAIDFSESNDVANAWMNSPAHKANVIKKEFTEIGIGVANGTYEGKNTTFVVEFFAKPAPKNSKEIATKVIANTDAKNESESAASEIAATAKVLGEQTTAAPVKSIARGGETRKDYLLSLFKRILSSPRTAVDYAFGTLVILSALALIFTVFVNIRVQHPALILSGLMIIITAAFFWSVNSNNLKLAVKVPSDTMAASVIKAF